MPRAEARSKIKAQIQKGGEILQKPIGTPADVNLLSGNYKKWDDFNEELLRILFSGDRVLSEYHDHVYISYSFGGGIGEELRYYTDRTRGAIARLESLEERLDLIPETLIRTVAPAPDGLSLLTKTLTSFHSVARQLRFRHDNRPTIEINDEYDLQDLLHALLKRDFKDVRPEEWVPSYAGKASRTDFLLKAERTIVETKRTRNVSSAKAIGDELIIDIARYKAHPDCANLVCFVYDPEGYIQNPEGLRSDLEKGSGDLTVRVFIEPKAH